MRILTKIECGLVIMADIAVNSENGGTVTLYDMAERRCISVKYLEQIVTRLRQSSLVKSIKGPHGGYVLARSPDRITIKEIVDAVDIAFVGSEIAELGESCGEITDILEELLWSKIETYLTNLTTSLTLSDIVNAMRKTPPQDEQTLMYYI